MFRNLNPFVRYAKTQWFTHRRVREVNVKNDFLFFYMVKGYFTYAADGVKGRLNSGEGLLVPPGKIYSIGYQYMEDSIFYVVNFDLDHSNCDHLNAYAPLPSTYKDKIKPSGQIFPPFDEVRHYTEIDDLLPMFTEMIDRFAERREHYHEMISSLFKTILLTIEIRRNEEKNTSSILSKVDAYIKDHYHEQITNQQIADALSYHPYYISSVIKKRTGRTLRDYLLEYRLEKAKVLLRQDRTSITDVSCQCGFSSHSYFTMTFRRAFGITPKQYAKKHTHKLY